MYVYCVFQTFHFLFSFSNPAASWSSELWFDFVEYIFEKVYEGDWLRIDWPSLKTSQENTKQHLPLYTHRTERMIDTIDLKCAKKQMKRDYLQPFLRIQFFKRVEFESYVMEEEVILWNT